MNKPTLRLYTGVLQGQTHIPMGDLTGAAVGWRRSIRRNGGFWRGEFSLVGERSNLLRWFNEYLGYHFEERSGGQRTWEGMIYELDLTLGGVTRRRSLDLMYNHVTTTYIDTDDAVQTSAPDLNEESIGRYGRREQLLTLDGFPQAAAEGYSDSFLTENCWPWPRVVGVKAEDGGADELRVVVCGYIFTANWRYETAGDASTDDLSAWVGEIVDADCEFLQTGTIESNTVQVRKETNLPMRALDVIDQLAELGDASQDRFRYYVDIDRRLYFREIDVTPLYFMRKGELYTTPGGRAGVNPWIVQPAVVRDMSYPVGAAQYGGWLADGRDFYIDEVEVSEAGLVLRTDIFDESEILNAQIHYEKVLADLARREEAERQRKKK